MNKAELKVELEIHTNLLIDIAKRTGVEWVFLRDIPDQIEKKFNALAEKAGVEINAFLDLATSEIAPGNNNYATLAIVLDNALDNALEHASAGNEQHVKAGEPFERQKTCEITRRVGLGYPLGLAVNKAEESLRHGQRGLDDILVAINCLAAAYIVMREEQQPIIRTNHLVLDRKLMSQVA